MEQLKMKKLKRRTFSEFKQIFKKNTEQIQDG